MADREEPTTLNIAAEAEAAGRAPGEALSLSETREEPATLNIAAEAEATGSAPGSVTLSPTQRAGMQLAWAVGLVIAFATGVILVDWSSLNDAAPTYYLESTVPEDVTTAKAQIENYTTLREAEQTRSARMFDVFVGSSLLPIFTAILGYIFGTRQAE